MFRLRQRICAKYLLQVGMRIYWHEIVIIRRLTLPRQVKLQTSKDIIPSTKNIKSDMDILSLTN